MLHILGGVQNCHHFHEHSQGTLGEGCKAAICFLKMLFMGHCDSERGPQNQHFQSTLFGAKRGVSKKTVHA